MQRIIKSIILLSTCIILHRSEICAQNYRLINPDRAMTFAKRDTADLDSVYYFIKTDSVVFDGTDSIYYFDHDIKFFGDLDCEYKNGYPTLLGEKMIVHPDSDATHIFLNQDGDSIYIKTKIAVGDVWHIYEWPNGTYVKATVVNKLARTILPDIEDTVIRIQLNVITNLGVTLVDTFPNYTKFDITENYGLIEFFNFNIFPLPDDSLSLVLRGLSDPDKGIVDVDAETAFDFGLGYEFHYREEVAPDIASGGDKRISAWKYFVMDSTRTASSSTYTMQRIKFDTIYFGGTPTSTVTWDTIDVVYNYADYGFLDTLEYCDFHATNYGFSDWYKNDTIYKGIAYKYIYDWFDYDAASGCLNNIIPLHYPEQTYGDGLGLMHYTDSTDASNYYSFDMVYFHVGLLEWGTPYDFSVLDESIDSYSANQISFFPNPAHETISWLISDATQYTLTLTSIDGRLIKTQAGVAIKGQMSNSVNDLAPGCYLLRMETASGNYFGKFIKE